MRSREELNSYLSPPKLIDTAVIASTTHTLTEDDINKRLFCTNASGCAVTVPDGWPAGATVIVQGALVAGDVVIVRGPGVYFESVGGSATKAVTAGGEVRISGIFATPGASVVAVNGAVA